MNTALIIVIAAVIATGISQIVEQIAWPKRRRAVLGAIDTTLTTVAQIYTVLEVARRDSAVSDQIELALVDLSEQESKLRRNKLVLQWT